MIFTFYSYKGGVGRSMALAAVAQLLARRGLRVLAVDFDLEAPGLERYFFDGERCRAERAEAGLMDLIQNYRHALSDEAEFERAEFKKLDRFIGEAVIEGGSRRGSVHLMTAGRREPAERLREYARAVRSFDWQDFFYNWNGDRFFDWLRRQWTDPQTGYDLVLVDSRTGVTEMGGVCAYQLADVAVLFCAPNYQNLDGTRDVAQDFISAGVMGLRHGRPLEILAIPARLDANHPKRHEFLADFDRELGSDGLPLVLAQAGLRYRDLALPYVPEFGVEERLVHDGLGGKVFEPLADALTLLAQPGDPLERFRGEALARLRGEAVAAATIVQADTSRASSGFDAFIDYGQPDREAALVLARQLEERGLRVFIDDASAQSGASWSEETERALDYSATLLVCFGLSSGSPARDGLLEKARRTGRTRIVPVLLPGSNESVMRSFGLDVVQQIDLRQGSDAEQLLRLIETLKRSAVVPSSEAPLTRDPYPGERPYMEDDARFFHGRDDEITALVAAIRDHPIVLLEGPAKVGKTSLVCAGLLPQLRVLSHAKGSWTTGRIVLMDATSDEFHLPVWIHEHSSRAETIQRSSTDVLIVDNVDTFTTSATSSVRATRLHRMKELVDRAASELRLLLIWRGMLPDAEYQDVLQSLQERACEHIFLAPLQGEALRRAVEQPAREAGHLLENGLTERLTESAGGTRNAILQIQLALAALWSERRRGWLTNKSLDALGHLGGVFQRHIAANLALLDESDQRAATVLFKRLSQLDANSLKLSPHPQAWSELETVPMIARVDATRLRDRLAAVGLIDLWREGPDLPSALHVGRTIRIALARPDPMHYLGGGNIVPDMDYFMWRKQLDLYVLHWHSARRSPEALLTGGALTEAERWLDTHADETTEVERALIDASIEARALMTSRVFISYADKDGEAFATTLRKRLEREEPEIGLWQNRANLKGGVGWRVPIEAALDKVTISVMVMTPAALRSEECRWEWRYARQSGVVVCPVMANSSVELAPEFKVLPQWMRKTHWYNLEHDWEPFCSYIKNTLQVRRVPFMARDLPTHFVNRSLEFDRLIDLLLDRGTGSPVTISTTLHGAAGCGKTTLATAVCHSEQMIEAYDDGILWVTLGETPNLLSELRKLYEACSGKPPTFTDQDDASQRLAEELDGRKYLLVIDDVRQPAHLVPFLGRGITSCARLITTRIPSLVEGGEQIEIGNMQGEESSALLSSRLQDWPDQVEAHRGELTTLASRLLDSPLLLELASGQLRLRMERNEPLAKALKSVQGALAKHGFTAFDGDNPHHRNEAFHATLGASLAELNPDSIDRLQELAIFPKDIDIALKVLEPYWRLGKRDTEDLAKRLNELALIDLDLSRATLRMHNQVRHSLERKLVDCTACHARLVERLPDPRVAAGTAYNEASRYALAWGVHHLLSAGRLDVVRERLLDFGWLSTKLERLGIQAVLEDFERLPAALAERRPIPLLHDTLKLVAHIVAYSPEQLAAQLLYRLPIDSELEIVSLCQAARRWRGCPWLGPTQVQMPPVFARVTVLEGHRHPVYGVAFSPDGTRIVSGGTDGTLRLWDVKSGQPIGGPMQGHEDVVSSMAFSPDGTRIVSGSRDKTLWLWNAETGQPIGAPLKGHADHVSSVAFSPNGRRIVSGSYDRTLRLWDAKNGRPIGAPMQWHRDPVTSVAFRPDGRRIVSGSFDGTLRLWDAKSSQRIGEPMLGHNDMVLSLDFNLDGTRIVSGSADKTLRVWDANSGKQMGEPIEGHKGWVAKVAFSPDGTRIVSGSWDNTLRLWQVESGEALSLVNLDVVVRAVAWHGNTLAVGATKGTLSILRVLEPDNPV